MAFGDSPIVDRYAQNEEKSEWRVREFLHQKAGFLCRNEVPDKGCDLDVELILEESKSSSWKFPIQLKSIEHLTLVNSGNFISLPFETSRLGYLMRRIPSMGLIILYAVEEDQCFYEYADRVYTRLMEDRESGDWKANDKVSIRVPHRNMLNVDSAKALHRTFTNRFEQALKMQNSHGEKYGLPTVSLTSDFQYDFHNLEHIKKFLAEYGMLLLNNYDLDVIHQMITQVPNLEIYRSKDLLLIAAVSYAESSMHTESRVFCTKLTKHPLNLSEQLTLRFVELKNELALGYIETDDYLEKLKKLDTENTDDQNKITIEINVTHYRLARLKAFQEIPSDVAASIDNMMKRISKSKCNERTKGLLTLWNCENLSYLISTIGSAKLGEMQIRQSLGNPLSLQERDHAALEIMTLETRFINTVYAINKSAVESNDKFLKAYSLSLDVKHFIHHQINYFSFEIPVNLMAGFEKRVANKISYAATAYHYFRELSIHKEAYESLCNMIEIIELAEQGYGMTIPHDKRGLYMVKEQMEQELEIGPRPIVLTQLIANKKQGGEGGENGMPILKDLSDEQIESLAKTTLVSFQLPEDRLPKIISEMQAYRMFHQRCTDPNIQILQFKNGYERSQMYASPIRFVLRNNATGLETIPSDDMNSLLNACKF